MRFWKLFLLVLLTVTLQLSFLGAMRPLGIIPNLFLVVVVYAGLICTASEAVSMALFGGILLDAVSGADFGLRTAFFVFLALAIVIIKRAGADFGNTAMVMAATLSATLIYNASIMATLASSLESAAWGGLIRLVLIEAGANILLALALRQVLVWWMGTGNLVPKFGGK